jgi:diguanylate cyclase (GGDEF)-like protein/PAS domain S-box-containing protein
LEASNTTVKRLPSPVPLSACLRLISDRFPTAAAFISFETVLPTAAAPITFLMLFSANLSAITAGFSLGAAAVAAVAWNRARSRLAESLLERQELEKSSSLLDVETQIMERMNAGAPLREVLDILTHAIERMAPQCLCSVLLLDEAGQQLFEGSGGGLPKEYMSAVNGLHIGPEVGACGSAAFNNQITVVEDIATDPRFAPVKDFVISFGLLACWSVPIRGSNHQPLGTFAMYHRRRAQPRNRELGIVEAAAHLAANVIERRRASERLNESEQRIAQTEKGATLGIWELDINDETLTLSPESAFQLGLPAAAQKLTTEHFRSLVHPDDRAVIASARAEAIRNGKLFHVEFRVMLNEEKVRWVRVQARVEHTVNQSARFVGISVDITEEKKTMAELEFRAAHDGLTGIWNRSALIDLMHREFEAAARIGATTGVIMLDIDHFKDVNDTYGHLAGDLALKEAARRIQDSVRSYDLVGRYGGEEFLIVLPRCDSEHINACAERIRFSIGDRPFSADQATFQLTASLGLTVVNAAIFTEHQALAAADAALYQAKELGRNRVACLDSAGAAEALFPVHVEGNI